MTLYYVSAKFRTSYMCCGCSIYLSIYLSCMYILGIVILLVINSCTRVKSIPYVVISLVMWEGNQ